MEPSAPAVSGVNWRAVAGLTAGAIALYLGFRALPTGTNLHHMDFRVSGADALEMCDPSRPQFIPVVASRSPVRVDLRVAAGALAPTAGRSSRFTLTLATAGGQPIGPVDLLTVHTRKLHLLVIDPTLGDYQHLHPTPGTRAGEWEFEHTPARGGVYRVFADFTPVVTGRGLYAFADYTADGTGAAAVPAPAPVPLGGEAATGPWRFRLATQDGGAVRAGVATTLVFAGRETDGGAVPLALVMDAYAHLVAFDADRSGFAHLHPRGATPGDYRVTPPDPRAPTLFFDLTIPRAGSYVVWAQINLADGQHFLPFALDVGP
jgi:hypothetical protein